MLTKLNTMPIAAIIALLFNRPTKKVSVKLYITLINIPIIVGIEVLTNSGKIGFVKMLNRLSSFESISTAPHFAFVSVNGDKVAVFKFCGGKTYTQYCRYIKFPSDNRSMT